MRESELVRFALEYLRSKKIFCWRNNTGGQFYEYKGKKGFFRFGEKGSPDIIGIYQGKFLGVECKIKGNSQSLAQKQFQHAVEAAGGLYWLVYTPEELLLKL